MLPASFTTQDPSMVRRFVIAQLTLNSFAFGIRRFDLSPEPTGVPKKLVQSNRCKTGPGKAVAGRPVASVA